MCESQSITAARLWGRSVPLIRRRRRRRPNWLSPFLLASCFFGQRAAAAAAAAEYVKGVFSLVKLFQL